jgi:trehalose 2-sulfotransferase
MLRFGVDVKQFYIIATIPRTGSHLLCELLESTGIAGHPREPFSGMNVPILSKQWKFEFVDFRDYLSEIVRRGMTPNGVSGTKLQWDQTNLIRQRLSLDGAKPGEIITKLFPDVSYIFLTRNDIRGLAISYYRAVKTNDWWQKKNVFNPQINAPDPPYDSTEIRQLEKQFSSLQENWIRFFSKTEIKPIHIDYAELDKDHAGVTRRCLEHLKLDPAAFDDSFQPTFIKQADAVSRSWRKRLDDEDILMEANKK